MPTVVTSKHLQGATELTLIADIKAGFVPIPDPTSYASRLRTTLEFLFQSRQRAVERDGLVGNAGPLERLRSLHFVHWSIHDQDRKLLLAVDFDGPWEPYIRAIVDEAGPILDVIFSHCEGYAGYSCYDGYQKFGEWVRKKQVNVDFFYAGAPDVTVDDLRYLQEFERKHTSGKRRESIENAAAKLRVGEPPSAPIDFARGREALSTLFRLSRLFPGASAPTSSDDRFVFDRVAALLTREVRLALFGNGNGKQRLSRPPDGLNPLETAAFEWGERALVKHDSKPSPPELEAPVNLAAVQGNILSKYPDVSHGCVLLARFEGPASALEFLRKWKDRIDTEQAPPGGPPEGFPIAPDTKFNLALTAGGLQVLGLSREELTLLPKEFQEGLAARAGMLGDLGRNHPDAWERPILNFPKPSHPPERIQLSSVDVVLILQRSAPAREGDHKFSDAHPLFHEITALGEEPGIQILHVQPLRSYDGGHFGLADGASQPRYRGSPEPNVAERDRVALGELLLGYKNERGERVAVEDPHGGGSSGEPVALPAQLLHNSTFLVIRKTSQNVAMFNEAMSDAQANSGLSPEAFKTTLLGRKPDGSSILEERGGPNDFDYEADKDGERCPFFSHVRRANPRNLRTQNGRALLPPRIVRRGMSYGSLYEDERDDSDRGLLFMAYASSIAEQYEVIQRWINGGNSSGVSSSHPDLLAGNFPDRAGADRLLSFSHEGQIKKLPLPQVPFTLLRWGLYLFVPSTTAIEYFLDRPKIRSVAKAPEAIAAAVQKLRALDAVDPKRGALEWKRLLEDRDQRLQARALWQYVRESGGALKTSYGVLVGSWHGVRTVLEEDKTFSVRRYWTRMRSTFGEHYLGMDPEPQALAADRESGTPAAHPGERPHGGDFDAKADDYTGYSSEVPAQAYLRSAEVPNQFAMDISRKAAYECAFQHTQAWFQRQSRLDADITTLARDVTYAVAAELFGLPGMPFMSSDGETPSADPPARCPVDFQRVSQFIFHPRPSVALGEAAERRGKVVKEQLSAFIASPDSAGAAFCKYYRERSKNLGEAPVESAPALTGPMAEVSALTGLVNGFTVPTSASFVSVMAQWIESQQLWRHQRWLYGKTTEDDAIRQKLLQGAAREEDLSGGPLVQGIIAALTNIPVPDLLHRVATGPRTLGKEAIAPGDRVVVGLASATLDRTLQGEADAWATLFGGNRGSSDYPVHACPGYKMAIGVLLGMVVGVLTQKNLTRLDKTRLGFERPLGAS